MKYTEWITNMDKKLKDKVSSLIVNKKFTREADKEKQFEHFKTVKITKHLIEHFKQCVTQRWLTLLPFSKHL